LKRLFIFIIASLIFSLILEKEGGAIPAFARKYRTSCTTCHVVFPKLNDFGEAFRANGFQIPQDDEIYVKDEPVSLGAEEWKMMWPYSVWPGEFPHLPPIAFLTRFAIKQREKGDVKGDFTFPETFLFLVGGTLGRDISFFGHIGEGRRVYIQFNNLFDNKIPRYALNLRIGLFEPGVVAFSNERRLTVVQNLFSTFNLEFANGNANNFQFDRQSGFEIDGVLFSRFKYLFGLTNGSGDSPDNNSKKDFYYRTAFKLWGMGFDGAGAELEESLKQTENWQDNSITVGHFGYFGANTASDVAGLGRKYNIDFIRLGVDFRINYQDLDLVGAYLWGDDENPANDGFDVGSSLFFCEANYVFFPWLVGALRFEDLNFKGPNSEDLNEIKKFIVSATVSIRANLKVVVDGEFVDGSRIRKGEDNSRDAFLARLDFAF